MDKELREQILKFYAFVTERDLEDVRREYLGIAPTGSPKHTIGSNRLYMATSTFIASHKADRHHHIALAKKSELKDYRESLESAIRLTSTDLEFNAGKIKAYKEVIQDFDERIASIEKSMESKE